MSVFLPHYLNFDLDLPKEADYTLSMFFDLIHYEIKWKNITYSEAKLDIDDIKLDLTRKYDKSLVKVDFPVLENWTISAENEINTWLIPADSLIKLQFVDFDLNTQFDLRLDDNGYLDLIVNDVNINFGDSFLYHENWFIEFWLH